MEWISDKLLFGVLVIKNLLVILLLLALMGINISSLSSSYYVVAVTIISVVTGGVSILEYFINIIIYRRVTRG